MVLRCIKKPYNSFFVINRYIAQQISILNDLVRVGEIPAKLKKLPTNVFYVRCNDVTQTHTESSTEVLQIQAECKYKFVHTELVI